ncbi:hypothetical protein R6Q59_010677 [Mikania micrantha]
MEAEGLSKHLKRCGRYYVQGWLKFVKDNKLSEGDKCLFCYFKQEDGKIFCLTHEWRTNEENQFCYGFILSSSNNHLINEELSTQ